jgi:hypothetical protein
MGSAKILNFMGTQPKNTHGIQTQTQPNPYPNFDSGSGITLGYPLYYTQSPIIRNGPIRLSIEFWGKFKK